MWVFIEFKIKIEVEVKTKIKIKIKLKLKLNYKCQRVTLAIGGFSPINRYVSDMWVFPSVYF